MTGKQLTRVDLFTDGACSGNPGKGGWGAILRYKKNEKEISGAELETTNNRMELTAVIKALESLKKPCEVIVHTDSRYVMQGAAEWMINWKNNGWRTSNKKPIKNIDLWQKLDELLAKHKVKWQWVRGHSGHPENERADLLARTAIQEQL